MATGNSTTSGNKKICLEDSKIENGKSFTPRDYQIEILESAKQRNTIACLGTGTGKTFIAVMLIRENSNELRIPFDEGGKRIFFLVPTVPLVTQQWKTIAEHTDLKVKGYYGNMDVDSWIKEQWESEFQSHQVLVMTAEIFRIIVSHQFISLRKINLLIFDECHRAQGDHPYRQAMKCMIDHDPEHMPRVFGLSASLLNGKCKPIQLEKRLQDLEKTLRSTITTASDITDLQKYGTDPDECVVYYRGYDSPLCQELSKETEEMITKLKQCKVSEGKTLENEDFWFTNDDQNVIFFDKPLKCLNSLVIILNNLGTWCAYKAAEMFSKEIESLNLRPYTETYKETVRQVQKFLSSFMDRCKGNGLEISYHCLPALPEKLKRLLELFSVIRTSKKFKSIDADNFTYDCDFMDDPENYRKKVDQLQKTKDSTVLPIHSIIFVEQRITAYVLCKWILEVTEKIPQFGFLKPEFVVGHGAAYKGGSKETAMSVIRQKKVLKDFREKKCNILIATSVLEEGMDIQQCNVVVRFDLPPDFRAYVQSKGRARAKNSIYVILVECGDGVKFIDDMCNFKTIEKMLLTKCHDRLMPEEDDIQAHMRDDLILPYMPFGKDGPRITSTSSISLINRYCAKLPCDMATKLTPKWNVKEVEPDYSKKTYFCKLWMPINSPLRKAIVGEEMPQKRLAKMSAALKACQQLHEIGELNDNLVPISSLVDKALEDELGAQEEEAEADGALPGTNRRRQIYKKRVPVVLSQSKPVSSTACVLHIFEMDLVVPLPKSLNPRERPLINPSDTTRGFGLLTAKKLPAICPFPLFTKSGKVMVNVKVVEPAFYVSDEELQLLEEFHRFLFTDVLWLEKGKCFAPDAADFSCYVVPVNKVYPFSNYCIDWKFICMTKSHPYNDVKRAEPKKPIPVASHADMFKDAVVLRSYIINCFENEAPSFHFVTRVCFDKTPNSEFDDNKYATYKGYYKIKYNVDILDDSQPLIETVRNGILSMWKPIYTSPKEVFDSDVELSKGKLRHKNYREYLIPELCIIHPFPAPLFQKALCLPTILFRLNTLLLADELRRSIAASGFIGTLHVKDGFQWPVFNLETSDKALIEQLINRGELKPESISSGFRPQDIIKSGPTIVSFEAKMNLTHHPGPCPSLVLQALTAKSTGDEFNLERLEIIGDSFLKYVMSIKTYVKYPLFDEGKLTKLRIGLIRNLYLYQCAKKKNLGQYLTCTSFNINRTWLPPCYTVEETIDPKSINKRAKSDKSTLATSSTHYYFQQQIISDKCVADSVEALIGTYLLSCGQQGALRLMSWIGLNPFSDKDVKGDRESDFENWPPIPRSPIICDVPQVQNCLLRLTSGFYTFEEKINYRFKNMAYLLQAFTHPSYSYNELTDCYQRLEFLGDAVLDYLVTRQLYEDPTYHSPGELTDLRSALVNNIYFASLSVKYSYHKYLKMLSPTLFKLLKQYVDLLQDSEAFKNFLAFGYYLEEIECFELEEVEVPKALGDIFESVAGAIYLDSGMSLDAVWKVYYPMMKPAIEHLCEHVPKSPVRELYELVGGRVFGDAVVKGDKTYIEATLPNGRKFIGIGPNKKVAKRSAAKRAIGEQRREMKMES